MVIKDRLTEIEERLSRATPGPWEAKRTDRGKCDGIAPSTHNHPPERGCYAYDDPGWTNCPASGEIVTTDSGYYGPNMDDAEFIAHAREDIPWLLDLVGRTKGEAG